VKDENEKAEEKRRDWKGEDDFPDVFMTFSSVEAVLRYSLCPALCKEGLLG
jgi:hypothetical protein